MALKYRRRIVLAKIETTYGTDATPTGAADAMQVANLALTPITGDKVSRDLVRANIGAQQQIHVGPHVMIEFDVEVAGSGTAGTAPAWGALMRACGMAETVNAGTDVQYDPVSANEESATLYFNLDGNQHIMLGCRGTWGLKMDKGQIPHWHFQITGLLGTIAANALPTPDFSAFQQPLAMTNVNTPTFTLHGYAAPMQTLNINQQNKVVYRNLVGVEDVEITERDVAGDALIETPQLGTQDYFSAITGDTLDALQLIHGTAAGNIVQIDAPQVQLTDPKNQDQDGAAMLQMTTTFVETSAGDDEIKITVK